MSSVGVAIPSIPPRKHQLARALSSVVSQTVFPSQINVAVDHRHKGAAHTRNRAWEGLSTEWVAFLDDDDEFLPHHIASLVNYALDTDSDMVFPWFKVFEDGEETDKDPLGAFGVSDDKIVPMLQSANFIPITVLIRREVLFEVGGFPEPNTKEWSNRDCEDWGCWLKVAKSGAKISHLPEVTWKWHHWGYGKPGVPGNTSGMPDRW